MTVLQELGSPVCFGTDEGRAMAQIVHDVAPGAAISFHTAFLGIADFANGIVDLANAGADGMGVAYFSSAGNNARDAYEANFDAGPNFSVGAFPSAVPQVAFWGGVAHDFDPGPGVDVFQSITVPVGASFTISFQWDSPFFSISGGAGSPNDLDIYVLNGAGTQVVAGDIMPNDAGGDAGELFSFSNSGPSTSYNIMIMSFSGPLPGLMKYVMFEGGGSTIINDFDTSSGTVYGHSNAAGGEAVGASDYRFTPAFGTDPAVVESFSSAGPTPILFDTAGNSIFDLRPKPEIVAPDGGDNTFFGFDVEPNGFPNFFGTSAAAPHAAGVAALMLEVDSTLTPGQIFTTLETTARDMDDPSTVGFDVGFDDATGFGLIDADAALASLTPPTPQPDISVAPLSLGFGDVTVGSTSDLVVTITNDGSADLEVTALSTTNPLFTVVSPVPPVTIVPLGTQDVTVRFSPVPTGAEAGSLNVASNDPDEALVGVPLSGAGVPPPPTVLSINAGGADYTTLGGDLFVADKAFAAGDFRYEGGSSDNIGPAISGTEDDALYQAVRFGSSFAYRFDGLAPGPYQVSLYFAEPNLNGAGRRVFDVLAEGVVMLDDYDIFAAAGGKRVAIVETFVLDVSDGRLDLDFVSSVRPAVVSAISVVSAGPPPAPEPDISVAPPSLDFGTVSVGATADLTTTIDNIGDADLNVSGLTTTNGVFTVVSPTTSVIIPPAGSQVVTLRFTPTAEVTENGDLDIASDDPDQPTVSVSLVAIGGPPPAPDISVTPQSLDFGGVIINTTSDLTVTIANDGTAGLTVSGLAASPSYSVIGATLPMIIPPAGFEQVTLRFAPTLEGPVPGSLDIASDDPDEGLVIVLLSGTGLPEPAPDISVAPPSLDFGTVSVGATADLTITIDNIGDADLNVSGLTTTNGVFTVVSPTTSVIIPPAGSQVVTLRFTPTAEVTENGDLDIASDDPDQPTVSVSLTGIGGPPPAPDISVAPPSLDFGTVSVGATADLTTTIDNLGDADLNVSGLTTTNGVFTVVSPTTSVIIPPAGSQVVTLRFTPTAEVTENGDLDIATDDPDHPTVSVSLTGIGTAPPPPPASAFRINAAGGDYTTLGGDLFAADKAFTAGDFGYEGGTEAAITNAISGTDDDALYQTIRYGTSFAYRFDGLAAGQYQVTLHFTEPQLTSAGGRLIDVLAEGTLVLDDYDIFVAAGGRRAAVTATFLVDVTDGQLDLEFLGVVRPALVSAVEVAGTAPEALSSILFQDRTSEAGIASLLFNSYVHTASWGDVNNDGLVDLFVGTFFSSTTDVPNKLLLNNGGTFVDASQPAVEIEGRASGSVFADFDNDGDLDLYVSNNRILNQTGATDEPSHIFRNDAGQFVDVTAGSGIDVQSNNGREVGILDFDGDGLLDLFIVADALRGSGPTLFLKNVGGFQFQDATASTGIPSDVHGLGLAVGDVTGNGWPDVFVAGGPTFDNTNRNYLFLANGDGTYREMDNSVIDWTPFTTGNEDWVSGGAFTDLNRDGKLDLVISHHFGSAEQQAIGAPLRVYMNRGLVGGDPVFEDITSLAGIPNILSKAPHVELQDFNNDGWPDIYTSIKIDTSDGIAPLIFTHEGLAGGDPSFASPALSNLHYYPGGPVADYDGDGRLDVFLEEFRSTFQGTPKDQGVVPSLLLRNTGATGNWLQVKVEDGLTPMGIGAKVKIYAVGGTQLLGFREIAVGYGFSSSQPAVAHFGLGAHAAVDVVIEMPFGGPVYRQDSVLVNQLIEVTG